MKQHVESASPAVPEPQPVDDARLQALFQQLGHRGDSYNVAHLRMMGLGIKLSPDELLALLNASQPKLTYAAAEISVLLRPFGLIVGVETGGKLHVYKTPVVEHSAAALAPRTASQQPNNEWSDSQIGRLIDQSQQISRMLAEAGVGSCTLTEGVRSLINRLESAPRTAPAPPPDIRCDACGDKVVVRADSTCVAAVPCAEKGQQVTLTEARDILADCVKRANTPQGPHPFLFDTMTLLQAKQVLGAISRAVVEEPRTAPAPSADPQVLIDARNVLKLTAVQPKPNHALVRLAQAVVDAAGCRVEDYRSGYSAGYSHAKNGEPMHDKDSAHRFFGIPDPRASLSSSPEADQEPTP
jgi:hypothetical protein